MGDDCVVIGAGVIGLTTAILLADAGNRVRVVAAQPPDRTTSRVAGALLGPVIPGPSERDNRWAANSFQTFVALATDPESGVRIDRGRLISALPGGVPPWAPALPGYAECTDDDRPAGFPTAFWVDLPVADMRRYLPYLVGRLDAAGVDIELADVPDLPAAARLAPVVVNCTGVGARSFVPDDTVAAAKGQHVIVANPGLTGFCYEGGVPDAWMGWFAHGDRVVLGGVDLGDDRDLTPDEDATRGILERCGRAESLLRDAEVLGVEVGLRPHRPTIRVEAERVDEATVVHHYGHAGGGVMLSWGSATDAVALAVGAA